MRGGLFFGTARFFIDRVQRASFNEERAHQIGRSTADPTVSEETQQRRARSAPATAARAMHDDYIRKNADFRSNAGLKCYINREAVPGCCAWCTAMAWRFEYGEEPDDIYRRHDNCDCTVTFENGRKRQDVWSKRTWEAPDKDAGASEPTVFTPEQAQTLQDEKGLTNWHRSGTMNFNDSSAYWHPITKRSIRSIPKITAFSPEVNSEIEKHCRQILLDLIEDKMGTEETVSFSLIDFSSKTKKGERAGGGVKPIHFDEPFIAIHNHPSNNPFSTVDLNIMQDNVNCMGIVVIGNSGDKLYIMKKTENFNRVGFFRYIRKRIDDAESDEANMPLQDFLRGCEKYGAEYYC